MAIRIKTFDLALYLVPLTFVATSVAVIYGLVFGTAQNGLVVRQIISAVVGLLVMLAASFVDYRFLRGTSWFMYLISIILLIIVIFFGKTVNGAENWINLGFFQLQPSEVAKAFLIINLAAFFNEKVGKLKWMDIIKSLLLITPILFLVLKEPDLGTVLVISFIYLVSLFAARPNRRQMIVIVTTLVLIFTVFMMSVFSIGPAKKLLHEYQRSRILVFIYPEQDPLGRGYNVKQAQISVGSGGLLGKGLGHGSQSQLQFLPEAHTDFIFAGLAESFGFVGSVVILLLYLYLIIRIVATSALAQDNFGTFIALGVAAMFLFQVMINVGMNLGVAPVTGIPLPLMSYGGSSLIMTLFMIGITQNIFIRHKKLSF